MQFNNSTSTKNMTPPHFRRLVGGSPLRLGFLLLPLALLCFALSASVALADDFKTMDGKEYKDATVTRAEPDGIVVKTKSGISKIYFAELPKEVQQRFNYNPQTASAYSAQQAAQYEVYQKQQEKQQEGARYRQQDADAQNRANIAKQQAANAGAQVQQDNEQVRQQQKAAEEANRHQEALEWAHRHRRHR
jgi:hypothetical protein